MHNKLIALLTIFSLNSISVQSQVCDCDIFPVKKECKVDCGIKILQSGTNEQIVQKLKVKKETAQRIVNVQTRRNYKEVTDFKDDLPLKYYQDLEQRFNLYLSNNLFQNNINGDNINGNQVIGNQFNGNPYITINNPNIDSIKYEIAQERKLKRTILSNFYREGNYIMERLSKDTLDSKLDSEMNSWFLNVLSYLNSIETSYATQFEFPSSSMAMTTSFNITRKENEGYYRGMILRNDILFDFITALR